MTPTERFLEEKGFAPTFNVYSNLKPHKPVLLKDLLKDYVSWLDKNEPVLEKEKETKESDEDIDPLY